MTTHIYPDNSIYKCECGSPAQEAIPTGKDKMVHICYKCENKYEINKKGFYAKSPDKTTSGT